MEKSETHFMSNSVNGVEKNGNTEQKKATCKICFEEMKPE